MKIIMMGNPVLFPKKWPGGISYTAITNAGGYYMLLRYSGDLFLAHIHNIRHYMEITLRAFSLSLDTFR